MFLVYYNPRQNKLRFIYYFPCEIKSPVRIIPKIPKNKINPINIKFFLLLLNKIPHSLYYFMNEKILKRLAAILAVRKAYYLTDRILLLVRLGQAVVDVISCTCRACACDGAVGSDGLLECEGIIEGEVLVDRGVAVVNLENQIRFRLPKGVASSTSP